jgi:hypothetical protein
MWQGVNATAGEYAGFETLFLADGDVLDVDAPEAITSANVIDEMNKLVLTLPTRVRRATEKPVIAVSSNVAEAFRTAILGLGGGSYLYQGETVKMTWQGQYDIIEICTNTTFLTTYVSQLLSSQVFSTASETKSRSTNTLPN